jgi:hypothetical protein
MIVLVIHCSLYLKWVWAIELDTAFVSLESIWKWATVLFARNVSKRPAAKAALRDNSIMQGLTLAEDSCRAASPAPKIRAAVWKQLPPRLQQTLLITLHWSTFCPLGFFLLHYHSLYWNICGLIGKIGLSHLTSIFRKRLNNFTPLCRNVLNSVFHYATE